MYIFDMLHEIAGMLSPVPMLVMFASTALGIVFGVLPGLTATLAVALLSTITFRLSQETALIALIGAYVGAVYGASQSAILIGIPGTSAAAATVRDGHRLAKQGRGGEAIANATFASMIGTIFGLVVMMLVMPLMVRLALQFTSIEFFLLALFGVLICGSLTSEDMAAKGWIAGILGLLVSTVGIETIQGYNRFTFGVPELMGGIEFVPVILGAFAIPQIVRGLRDLDPQTAGRLEIGKLLPDFGFLRRCKALIARSGLIGVGIGSIPGVGEDIAAWASYDAAKRADDDPDSFGQGNMRGVIAPEVAANSCIGGAIIPVLTLAVPGSPPAAMLLGAMWLHGLRPGPMLASENPEIIAQIGAYLFWGAIAICVCGLILVRLTVLALRVPASIFLPMVAVVSVLGSYALGLNTFNVMLMFAFGAVAYLLEEMKYPVAPLVIGLILGNMADVGLRRALLTTQGDVLAFLERPVALVFLGLILLSLFGRAGWLKGLIGAGRRRIGMRPRSSGK
ncbi:tripartite tricarboxylate transporter permease [Paralimibaculum aggregatum]|uniref:Tripartite tricarboxylate transporter permease n=1 Tax=Paralimibaculum aggregatum TaxID=3036245 RepID=A0ABQ6LIM8_9RHOB|nr:tripartite tricarboxylate transporter permease [Limibaculum sp. NKW23]GMG83145.1 tripartite tricarboxylate transporter permease [Limibaculum sp. NKW23]